MKIRATTKTQRPNPKYTLKRTQSRRLSPQFPSKEGTFSKGVKS